MKITEEELQPGRDLFNIAGICPHSDICLWMKRSIIFQISDTLLEDCLGENCPILVFRKTFENSSPAFYAEALGLSRFDKVLKTANAMAMKKKRVKRKRQWRLKRRTESLHVFGQLFVLAVFPLFLEAKRIPFLTSAEIAEFRNNYREAEAYQTVKEMRKISSEWLEQMTSVTKYLVSNYERYPAAITYLVYLFLKGIEKDQLPDIGKMSREEKDKFFLEIQKAIARNKKTDR